MHINPFCLEQRPYRGCPARGFFALLRKWIAALLPALCLMLCAGCVGSRGTYPDRTASVTAPEHTFIPTAAPTPTAVPTPAPTPTPEPTPEPTAAPDIVVNDAEALIAALAAPSGAETGNRPVVLALGGDIEVQGLTVARPCVVRLEAHELKVAGELFIACENGSVRFENGKLKADRLGAFARGTDLVLDKELSGCETEFGTEPDTAPGAVPGIDNFNILLRSLNGTPAGETCVQVRSREELERLLDPELLPVLRAGDAFRIMFDPESEAALGELPFIDVPLSDLLWETPGAPSPEYVSMYFNVRAYNGAEMAAFGLGGSGSAKLGKIDYSAKTGLQGQLQWEIRGNTVRLAVPLHVGEDFMKYARLDFGVDGGSAEPNPEAVNGDGSIYLTRFKTLTVTDALGGTRVYRVDIARKYGSIPVVLIETENGAPIESQEDYLRCRVSVVNTESSGFEALAFTDAGIRGRGHSTWKWDKKPWRVKFDSGVSLFGLHKAKDWVLLANYSDKSLIRNVVAFDMARGLSFGFVPHQFPVDVYLNGEYQGVYTMGEQIERNQERVDIGRDYEDPDTGYLLEIGGSNPDDVRGRDYFHAGLLKFVTIKSPDSRQMSEEHYKFISEYVAAADREVQALGDYYEYVDANALYDWLIMCELTCNIDTAFRRSCFITKDKGGKLCFGPLWDFDLAMGNFSRDGGDYTSWAATGREYVGDTWFGRLLEDPKFTEPFKARWFEMRDDILRRAMDSIDRNAALLEYSQQENFLRWPIWDVRAGYQPSSMKQYNTYEKQIQFLKDWLTERAAWLDEAIGAL
ncbi:MAG: CotH kinase family protein [Clostridia bacterium]|nr:CotH kinase family protein [Clostridia bacterium]